MSNNLIELIQKLKKFKTAIECTNNKEDFLKQMNELWLFFNNYNDIKTFELFYDTPEFIIFKEFFQAQDSVFEPELDKYEAMVFLKNHSGGDILKKLNYFSKSVFIQIEEEIEAIERTNIKKLVMIGCGSMPETVIFLAQNMNIKEIIALDSDFNAVLLAREVIYQLKLSHKVDVQHSLGEDYDYFDADYVHIASFVQRKKEILYQISKVKKRGVKVIVRTPELLSTLVHEDIPHNTPLYFKKKVKKNRGFCSFSIFETL